MKPTQHTTTVQGRTVHHCVARNIDLGAKRKRGPRRKSLRVLIEIANRAGLAVTAMHADGSISTAEPNSDQHDQNDHANVASNGEIIL